MAIFKKCHAGRFGRSAADTGSLWITLGTATGRSWLGRHPLTALPIPRTTPVMSKAAIRISSSSTSRNATLGLGRAGGGQFSWKSGPLPERLSRITRCRHHRVGRSYDVRPKPPLSGIQSYAARTKRNGPVGKLQYFFDRLMTNLKTV